MSSILKGVINETQNSVFLTETITYKLWESAGKKIVEAQLTADQIKQLFANIEQGATAAGGNRTMIGKGVDATSAVNKAWEDLKTKVQNSGPIKNVDAMYDQAAEKLKQATGGDQGVMKYVQKYRDFAKEHPIAQSFIYSALIAAAGISGAGLGGAAALGLFKLVDKLLQGEKFSSAAYQGAKTGALAYGASKIGDLIKGKPADVDPNMKYQPNVGQIKAGQGAGNVVDYGGQMVSGASDPSVARLANWAVKNFDLNKFDYVPKGGTVYIYDKTGELVGSLATDPGLRKAGIVTGKQALELMKKAAGVSESIDLNEATIKLVFSRAALECDKQLTEGIMDTLKGAAGKAAGAVKQFGTNLTTKVTADKLNSAWEKAGKPTESGVIATLLVKNGVPKDVMLDVFANMKIPVTSSPAPAAKPTTPTLNTTAVRPAAKPSAPASLPQQPAATAPTSSAPAKPAVNPELQKRLAARKAGKPVYSGGLEEGEDKKAELDENLRKWFKEKWVRFGPDGKIRGACARGDDSEGKPKCLPQAKAHALGKKGRKYAAAKKRREDPNPERSGPAKNVATKKKSNEGVQENMQANYKNYSTQDLLRMIKTIKRDEIGMKIIKAISNELIRRKEGVVEAGMPASVIKSKQRYSKMTPAEFAQAHGTKSDDELKAMAWRHGYGKGSTHYVDKRNKGKQGVAEGFSDISGLMSASNLNNSYIITAELAEGGKKKFRVKAQNERVAIEKFKKHHSMAKIINVEDEGVKEGSKYPRNPASYHLKKYPVPQDQMAKPVKKEPRKPEKKPDEKLDELKCWPGYSRVKGVPAGAPGSCKKKTNEEHQQCPECGGAMYEVSLMNEKKDACYYKVKSRYKVWPSAYASGALVKCRKKGAKNWGSKSKSNEGQIYSTGGGAGEAQRWYTPKDNLGESSSILEGIQQVDEVNWKKWAATGALAGAAALSAMNPAQARVSPQDDGSMSPSFAQQVSQNSMAFKVIKDIGNGFEQVNYKGMNGVRDNENGKIILISKIPGNAQIVTIANGKETTDYVDIKSLGNETKQALQSIFNPVSSGSIPKPTQGVSVEGDTLTFNGKNYDIVKIYPNGPSPRLSQIDGQVNVSPVDFGIRSMGVFTAKLKGNTAYVYID